MAAREACKMVADAMSTNLQTKLDALSVVSGETAPTIADFRDTYGDDEPENDRDWPLIATLVDPTATPEAQFQNFEKMDFKVPMVVLYVSNDRDTADARATASYATRAVLQVLNDLLIARSSQNNVFLLNITEPFIEFGLDNEDRVGAAVRFNMHMRDESP